MFAAVIKNYIVYKCNKIQAGFNNQNNLFYQLNYLVKWVGHSARALFPLMSKKHLVLDIVK
jgi:hypothetical protein